MDALVLLLPVWIAALVTPGPDTLAVSYVSLSGGRRAGLACAVGVALGIAAWAMAALSGLALLFAQVGWLYRLVTLLGAAYLAFLGVKLLAAAWRDGDVAAPSVAIDRTARAAALTLPGSFRRGLVTNLANPKAAALFGSLFAVALPPHPGLGEAALVVLAFAGTTLAWYALLATVLARPRAAAAYRRAARGVNGVAGIAFLGFGARLAWTETR
jgi:threonine/homoserine/homoserine lactone efflux protein